ncbi:MAG: sulfur oxidation c-type cytochrome SoxA [Burkholderiales bacterium]
MGSAALLRIFLFAVTLAWPVASSAQTGSPAVEPQRVLRLDQLRSGSSFMSADLRAMQADDFANPAMLWAERGAAAWARPAGAAGRSCASCHQDAQTSMRGVAARYPRFDAGTKTLINLEGRVNLCRTGQQGVAALPYESEELLALTTHIARASRGQPLAARIDGPAREHFERGRTLYQTRIGQMNLACMHCHDWNAGRRLLSETISQGHPNAYPAYRLEWQSIGSLHRRLRACFFGVRAEMPAAGAAELVDLELFLVWRAQGLPVETPGVRR